MTALIRKPGDGRMTGVAGDIYTIKISGAETGGSFALLEAIVPPGGGPPPHRHSREDETFYILDGELEIVAGGETSAAGAGTVILLPKGSVHQFKNTGTTAARMLILAAPAGLEEFFAEVSQEPGTFSADNPPAIDPSQIGKMLELAPKYGMEIIPPDH
ncbi:cupin domain-containing protein [Leisingera thetidis]|uniref:cupin domain-containing protein n=1 Tax=Leisingera thetidis TaxID=2930199 RepID=UPI0021F6ECFA|nr:cupin domain-containing protein [Leisingera thetidis]